MKLGVADRQVVYRPASRPSLVDNLVDPCFIPAEGLGNALDWKSVVRCLDQDVTTR
jgi:hypothetical protein